MPLGQQAPDAVDAGGAVGLQAFAQTVHAQHALLLDGFDRHEVHLRPAGGFTNGRPLQGAPGTAARPFARHKQSAGLFVSGLSVVGVVLDTGALAPVIVEFSGCRRQSAVTPGSAS